MHKKLGKITFILCCVLSALSLGVQSAFAAPLIRDAEIEHTLRIYSDPIFKANGLKPSAVNIFIVNDDSLNAFVAGGANMFLHTGMILASTSPDMLLGVIAHETGHISGGHLARGGEQLKNAEMGAIFTYVLGAAAAAASGKPEAAAAVITGGHNAVARNFLAYTRSHEEAADQSALRVLDQLAISSSGMLRVFELLRRHERERVGSPDPYLLTHPLTSLRIENIRRHTQSSAIAEGKYPEKLNAMHQRMLAKLYSFLKSPERTLMRYPLSDKSVAALMARAIAYYKMPDTDRAVSEMDSIIAELPNDPFLHELKGQILFENNRPREALASYQKAVQLLADSPLILTELGKVELAQQDPTLIPSAITHLEKATRLDKTHAHAWRLLATAYGKAGNNAMSSLALAEEAMLLDDYKRALSHVQQAMSQLTPDSPAYRRAQDLKIHASNAENDKQKAKSPF